MALAELLAETLWDLLHALSVSLVLLAPLLVIVVPVAWFLLRRQG